MHSTRMLTKLELANRAQAAILAHEAGLYDWSDSLWGLGCQGRVSAGRPLPRQGCCASLRDGLRPPLTRGLGRPSGRRYRQARGPARWVRAARARFFGLTVWWLPAQDRRWGRSTRLSTSPFRCSYDLSCRRARLAESPVAAGGLLSRSFRLSDSRSRVSWIDTITDGHRRTRRRPQGRPPCLVTCRFVAHGWRVQTAAPRGVRRVARAPRPALPGFVASS